MLKAVWYSYFWVYIVVALPLLAKVLYLDKLGRVRQRDKLVQKFLANVGRRMIKLSGSTVAVRGLENLPSHEPVLYVSNHQSHFDSAIILGYIPRSKGFVAAIEASRFPIWSIWFRYAPTVFLERGNMRQSLNAINEGVELLRQGYSLVVFPEGVISRTPELGEFRRGAFKLATVSGVPIVPLTVKHSHQIMGKDNSRIQATNVELIVAPPIPTEGLCKEELAKLPERVRHIIEGNLSS